MGNIVKILTLIYTMIIINIMHINHVNKSLVKHTFYVEPIKNWMYTLISIFNIF